VDFDPFSTRESATFEILWPSKISDGRDAIGPKRHPQTDTGNRHAVRYSFILGNQMSKSEVWDTDILQSINLEKIVKVYDYSDYV
jgi:hypothetical protein